MMMRRNPPDVRLPGGYTVRSLLGRGALGASYLAIKRGAKEKRVFKVLDHPEWLADLPVLRVPGVWLGGKSPAGEPGWVWSKYVPQGSLRGCMDRGTLPAREFGAILKASLGILERVHAEGAVHGCLKPENLLLPDHETVVITDFGHLPLLRSKDEGAGAAYLYGRVVSRELRAPFTYLPPEALASNTAEPRVDVYGVGAILREGVEGKGNRPPIPAGLRAVIRSLTNPPSDDYPSAREARALLDSVPDGEWDRLPLIAGSVPGPQEREESPDALFSFVEIPDRPVPVAVALPSEMTVFDVAGGPPKASGSAEKPTGEGSAEEDPKPLDPAEALRFLDSMKKKSAPKGEKEEKAGVQGAFGLVVMGVPEGEKRDTIAELIGPLMDISREEALQKATEPVISVLRGVSKVEAEKAFKRFKNARVSARITTRLKKQK